MRNVWRLFVCDMKRLFSNIITVIIALGLILLPSIFAWYNILACWDVFNNTGNLSVAVANSDEGYESDLVPLRVNIGEQVVSSLRANSDIHWVFTDEEEAVDGAKEGRYYAAVVIPQNFSADMMTFYSDDIKHAQIIYYSNSKKNAIAPKITGQGADAVSYEVNRAFAEEISKVALALAQSLNNASNDYDLSGRMSDLSTHVDRLGSLTDQTGTALGLYAQLATSAQQLVNDSMGLIQSAETSVSDVRSTIDTDSSSIATDLDAIDQSIAGLSKALDTTLQSFDAIEQAADALAGSPQAAQDLAKLMTDAADSVSTQKADLQNIYNELAALRDLVPDDQKPPIDSSLKQLQSAIDYLQKTEDSLRQGASELQSGELSPDDAAKQLKEISAEAKAQIQSLKDDFDNNLADNLQEVKNSSAVLLQNLSASADDLSTASNNLTAAGDSVSTELSEAAQSINAASDQLHATADELHQLSAQINAALATGDQNALKQVITANVDAMSTALAAPVATERTAIFPSGNFGSAMSPLYTTIALFVGALLIMVAVKPFVTERDIKAAGLVDPKPRQMFTGRYGVVAFFALAQATVMAIGHIFFLQVQVDNPWLLLVCFWGTSIVFSFISYALVVSFANLGKAIMVLMLIVQVTGCGGIGVHP